MHALVVFESMYGNTEAIARAVAEGLSTRADVDVAEVGTAPTVLDHFDLLVVGGPTHAYGMSRPHTRETAAERADGELVSQSIGQREWLATIDGGTQGLAAAVFDTRIAKPRLPGSAARAAGRRLRRLGVQLVIRPESFYVADGSGPLVDGEVQRARRWGEAIGLKLAVGMRGRRAAEA